ncbi:Hypothetical protein R9X50_00634100 [Acrodontium crateriforme]|uniref:2,6-dihydroxypyridine 3-monooxygenase substrate binding domain-containing protein n=1 Tax=Acrodontium crateriforme TaxID=150365 RepID=A0AAQ3MBE5_9PEZI|nr:Hypothetical protein R9X50_00634100 [Acrodontium crateriforme]
MTTMDIAHKSVVVVGGSLGGLMHALVFLSLPSPPKVTILERSPTNLLHNQGAGIVAGTEVLQFFERFVSRGRDIAVTSPLRHYLDRHGKEMPESVAYWQQRMTSWDLLYHLLRGRVDGLETEYAKDLTSDERPKASYRNGCTVMSVERTQLGDIEVSWTEPDSVVQTIRADLVIAADGASSTIRKLLLPQVERRYAGYVAWRGTVSENDLSAEAKEAFIEKFTFYHREGLQILGYLIPAPPNGDLTPGKRRFNWVWYRNYEKGSPELEELMTDVHGKRHAITLPVGGIQGQIWEKQKTYANEMLPPQFAEAVNKTQHPFVQAITDCIAPHNSFFDGKVLLVADALAGFRPHTAASTGQAAFDALYMDRWLRGEIDKEDYDETVMDFAKRVQQHGVNLGDRSQFGKHSLNG